MYAPGPSSLSYWRTTAIDNVLAAKFNAMVTSGAMTEEERDRLWPVLADLRSNPDDPTTDAKIMELLRRYAPDDPIRSKYPS